MLHKHSFFNKHKAYERIEPAVAQPGIFHGRGGFLG